MVIADSRLAAALRPFERRAIAATFVGASAFGLVAATLAAELAWLAGARTLPILAAPIVAALALSAAYAVWRRPTRVALARTIDQRARLSDLVVSAVQCEGDGMPSLVRDAAVAALSRLSPPAALPVAAPASWRRWLLAAGVVQVIVLMAFWRAPAARPQESALASLTLPAGSASPNATLSNAPAPGAQPSDSTSTPAQRSAAAGPKPVGDALTRGDAMSSGTPPNASGAAGDPARLALSNAEDAIAAGRVPLARRLIVERYFTALHIQQRPPR